MQGALKGVATIEMTYIIPVFLLLLFVIVSITFYFHDKSVLNGIAYEATTLSSQKIRTPKGVNVEEIETYIQQNVSRKMIMLTDTKIEVKIENENITVKITAKYQKMAVIVEQHSTNEKPETFIRNIMKIKPDE